MSIENMIMENLYMGFGCLDVRWRGFQMKALESAEMKILPKLVLHLITDVNFTGRKWHLYELQHFKIGNGEGYYSSADESSLDHVHL